LFFQSDVGRVAACNGHLVIAGGYHPHAAIPLTLSKMSSDFFKFFQKKVFCRCLPYLSNNSKKRIPGRMKNLMLIFLDLLPIMICAW